MFKIALTKASREAYEATPTLNIIIAKIERENLARVRPTVIAKELGVSIPTVERHLRKLRKLNLIIPDEAEGDKPRGVFNWRVNPYLGWSGGTDMLAAYVKALPENHPWKGYNELDLSPEVSL